MQWDSESCSLCVISLDGDWCTPLYSRGMAFNYCCANTVHCLYNCCLSNTVPAVAQVRWMWLILLIQAIGVSQPLKSIPCECPSRMGVVMLSESQSEFLAAEAFFAWSEVLMLKKKKYWFWLIVVVFVTGGLYTLASFLLWVYPVPLGQHYWCWMAVIPHSRSAVQFSSACVCACVCMEWLWINWSI